MKGRKGDAQRPRSPRPDDLTELLAENAALGRIGAPGDLAGAVRLLACDETGFITGKILTVSGGCRR